MCARFRQVESLETSMPWARRTTVIKWFYFQRFIYFFRCLSLVCFFGFVSQKWFLHAEFWFYLVSFFFCWVECFFFHTFGSFYRQWAWGCASNLYDAVNRLYSFFRSFLNQNEIMKNIIIIIIWFSRKQKRKRMRKTEFRTGIPIAWKIHRNFNENIKSESNTHKIRIK